MLLVVFGTALCAAATAYACTAVWAALTEPSRLGRPRTGRPGAARPVSVLKPLCGDEPRLYENLRSFCEQNHPNFQVLFGLRDERDPAAAVVRRLQGEFPKADLSLVIDPRVHGSNLKVSNLINLLPHARHEWLLIADSDIGVGPDHLARVTEPLADRSVGVVTCLYRGAPQDELWSRLGAQYIDEWFVPSVLVARRFGSTRFAFGATIALRRDALEAAGGFEALRNLLADDFWLGEFTRRRGLRTVLSDVMPSTDVADRTPAEVWTHELRWMQTIRTAAPAGFAFSFLTFTFPVLAMGVLLAPTPLCAAIAGVGAGARILLHLAQRHLRPEGVPAFDLLLVPVRDMLLASSWLAAHTGPWVRWRNQVFNVWSERTATTAG